MAVPLSGRFTVSSAPEFVYVQPVRARIPEGTDLAYLTLLIAVLGETVATAALKATEGFSRPLPSLIVVAGYGLAFYCLSLTLRTIPVGIAYAIWSGVGIVLITLLGWALYRQVPDVPAIVGMGLIVCGVLVLNLFSRTGNHP